MRFLFRLLLRVVCFVVGHGWQELLRVETEDIVIEGRTILAWKEFRRCRCGALGLRVWLDAGRLNDADLDDDTDPDIGSSLTE